MYAPYNFEFDNHIFFCKNEINENNDSTLQYLFLLSDLCNFPIFDVIPKNFTISTKNSSCCFNIELLKDSSSIISDQLQINPNCSNFFLNINDEENILGKFEQMYNGQNVIFNEDELPLSQRITKLLQIKNCPNYLKPKSLHINEVIFKSESVINDLNKGMKICLRSFVNFLQNEELQSFLIITNKNKYKCNIFGIRSSKIIYEILEKNPSNNQYIYDFEDEYNEFQYICDVFNFKQVEINSNNMDALKEIAIDLRITSILDQIDKYINNYEKYSHQIDENETIIDSIDHLFDWLYNIHELTVEKVSILIIHSKWIENEENVQELAAFILQVVKADYHLHNEIADLLIQLNDESNVSNYLSILLPFIVHKLMNFYMPIQKPNIQNPIQEQYSDYDDFKPINGLNDKKNKNIFLFIRILYKKGIISKEEIYDKLKNYSFQNKDLNAFFMPEIIEANLKAKNFPSRYFSKYLVNYLPDKIDIYEKMLDNCEPNDLIVRSLRYDDVDTLQSIIISNQIDIVKSNVPYDIFEDFDQPLTLINYAALFGSLKCFKYLFLNNGKVDLKTLYFAVNGGNIEIIKIVDQHCTSLEENSFLCLIPSIVKHKNELFDWIFNQKFSCKDKIVNYMNDIALISASNGNAHSLIEIIDKGFDISSNYFPKIIEEASKNGFLKLTQLLIDLVVKKTKNYSIDNLNFNAVDYKSFVQFGSLSIFKLFVDKINHDDLEEAIYTAIEMDHMKIVSYYFNNIVDKNVKISKQFIKLSLDSSLKKKTDDCFNYIMEKFKLFYPNILNLELFIILLNNACMYGNIKASQTIANLIYKENPRFDFSAAFTKASSSNSLDICKFFIEKKMVIDYKKLSFNVSKLGSIDKNLFSEIIKNADPILKKKFNRCIYYAISKNNKNLVEFLLKENVSYKYTLIDAVSSNNLEMANLILNHDSQPSFINRNKEGESALHFAVENENLAIVKRLLSIQGINPNIYNQKKELPITKAIKCNNFEITEAFLDYYGDDFQSDIWILYEIMKTITEKFALSSEKNENILKIIKRILQIKTIDPNINDSETLLYLACAYNEMEIVEILLTFDKIDVNKYSTQSGDSPLIVALKKENLNIAKKLIECPKTNINFRNVNKETALTIAVYKKQKEIIDLLINDKRFDPFESRLDYSFYISDNEISKKLIELKSLDVNYLYVEMNEKKNDKPRGPLNMLFLSEKKEDQTPLTNSVIKNNEEKIDMIINHHSFDINRSQINLALNITINNNNIPIFQKLLECTHNNFNISYQNNTLLEIAASKPNLEIIRFILNHPNFNPNDKQIVTAFIEAFNHHMNDKNHEDNSIEAMKLIFDFDKSHSNIINFKKLIPNGQSFFSIIYYDYDSIDKVSDFLLNNGADPNAPDEFNVYPLENAIYNKSLGFITSLINSKKINFQQRIRGKTYLHMAAKMNKSEILKLILDLNVIDINSVDKKGRTPLFEACIYESINCANLLFKKEDLDYLHRDNKGKDVLKKIAHLSDDEYNQAIKSKENYRKKIIQILKKKNIHGNIDEDISDIELEEKNQRNILYESDEEKYNDDESEYESSTDLSSEDDEED